MHRTPIPFLGLLALLAVVPADGQSSAEPPRVRELAPEELDARTLVDILTPREEAPPELRARSLSTPDVRCDFYRGQRARGIEVRPQSDDVALRVHFAFDSAQLTPEAKHSLDELGRALTDRSLAACCFEIQGHTDSLGSDDYNLDLSERRARSVVRYLVDRYAIDPERLLVSGLGEGDPIADNDSERGRSRNRRVQVSNLGYGSPES